MNIMIWGAGGIGCYYGARLQLAGHQVTYVARGDHLQAMQAKGLSVQHESLHFDGRVRAISQQQLQQDCRCKDFDLIIITLKSTATVAALGDLQDWLRQGTCPLLSLQNGVDNEPLIAAAVGQARTLGGLAVRIGGHIEQPGKVVARGVAQVLIGAWPSAEAAAAVTGRTDLASWHKLLVAANIDARLSDDIRRELWRKLLINNGLNPLSAITGLDTRALTSDPAFARAIVAIMAETAVAASADGVDLGGADVDEMFALISGFDAIKTSMLVDLEKGRELEIDAISGAVLARSRQLGVQAPLTELVDALLRRQGVRQAGG